MIVSILVWLLCIGASIGALYQAFLFYKAMLASDPGTPRMIEIAGFVRTGANAYMQQQYKVIGIMFALIFILLLVAAFALQVLSPFVPFAFVISGFLSGLAGWLGMRTATQASNRTCAGAQQSLNQGLQVAFRSGAVMGLVVVGLGLLDLSLWFVVLRWIFQLDLQTLSITMLGFGMGASGQALFARVGGGIFTKAADVGADLVGKVEKGIPEDDPRNPATIADNVGDNVGDVAGMGADLYESYYGSLLAASALGVAAFSNDRLLVASGIPATPETLLAYQTSALFLPLGIAAIGILSSITGMYFVRTQGDASQRSLLAALARGINVSTALVIVGSLLLTLILMFQFWGIALSVTVGLLSGWLIGKWTEYSTSDEYKPTRDLADQTVTGPATVIIAGIAEGMMSTWVPVLVISVGTLAAYGFASGWNFESVNHFGLGLYGVGVAAVGMLSTLGITLATDAYGPIADNAGGNAQMAELDPEVRERTDALDSLGNTTAATGKGFAIGSAALTTLALLAAYVEAVRDSFQQWGRVAVVADAQPGLYKLGPQLVEQVIDKGTRHAWMVFPGGLQDPAWKALPTGKGPVLVDQSQFAFTPLAKGEDKGRRAELVSAKGEHSLELVRVDSAHLRDFTRFYDATVMNPKVLVGIFLGTMITFVFCALTIKAVGRAANKMVEEVRRQFREKPGIIDGTDKPDYDGPVRISTKAAQREMIVPTIIGLLAPIATGLILGVGGVLGLLVGALTSGFCVAIFMANAGGAWDNAKKWIEAGHHGGKGTDAHKAAVVGDTVGDPFKDTSGPALNILIKLMSMVSVVAAGLIVRYSLSAAGIF